MAVYQFRIKKNGSAGGVKYTEGMNIEVIDPKARKGENPWNTKVKDLFIQEFAKKYNVGANNLSGIKMLFNRDSCDVTEM
jgi:hypothetical protein